jgi:hypothetical protein
MAYLKSRDYGIIHYIDNNNIQNIDFQLNRLNQQVLRKTYSQTSESYSDSEAEAMKNHIETDNQIRYSHLLYDIIQKGGFEIER